MSGGKGAQVRLDVDWLGVTDVAYAEGDDLAAWGRDVGMAAKAIFGDLPLLLHMLRHGPDCSGLEAPLVWCELPAETATLDVLRVFSPDALRTFYYPPTIVNTHSDLRARADAATHALLLAYSEKTGIRDSVGMVLHPEPGAVMVLQAVLPRSMALDAYQRRRLTWLGLHIETALRLRLRGGEGLRAVIGPSGRVEHMQPGAPPLERLERAVQVIQHARRQRKSGADALALWQAMVAGELSVVERTIGSRTHYFFIENPPHRQPFQALTTGEQDAISSICRAQSNKVAAYELGISDGGLSRRLASAACKLGLASRMDLVRIAAMLSHDPRARFEQTALSASEEQVLELLTRGLSNAEIAKIRSRSARTIANQVASLLRKTNSVGRKALVVKSTHRPRA